MVNNNRLGEVIEASTTEFTIQSYELYDAPPLGSLVRCGSSEVGVVYGIVFEVATRSLDSARRPIARGRDEDSEAAIYQENPQLNRLLTTEFRALTVGHRDGGESSMNITLRAATVDDHRAIYEIMACPGVVRNTLQLPYVSLDSRRDRMESFKPTDYVFVAEVDGRVVSNIGLHRRDGIMSHTAGFGMSVHDDFQGQGVGTELMVTMLDLADNRLNLRRVDLHVFTDNEPGVALYKKFGFEIEGTHKNFAFREGQYVDSYSMARLRL